MSYTIRPIIESDLVEVLAIARDRFLDPWSLENFTYSMNSELHYSYIATDNDKIIGYVILSVIADEAELLDIAVLAEYEGKGVASLLLSNALNYALQQGANKCFLEVRDNNEAAISLYKHYGFEDLYTRKNYYPLYSADAIVMNKSLDTFKC